MAAVTDVAVTLNALAMGTGTFYEIDPAGIGGLGSPAAKTADTAYDGRDGSFAAPDYLDVRVVTIPVTILADLTQPDPQADAFTKLAALNTAWAPANDGINLTLTLTLPGWGTVLLVGRPREVVADLTDMKSGVIAALCRFDGIIPNFGT